MIAAHEQTGKFIDAPAYEAAAELLVEEKAELKPGQRVSSYEIDSLINRGGMGEACECYRLAKNDRRSQG